MSKVIKHTKRYEVQRKVGFRWEVCMSYDHLEDAKSFARRQEDLGWYKYRVVDTEADE